MELWQEEQNHTAINESLYGESLLCGVLGKLFFQFPDREWYQLLADEGIFLELPITADRAEISEGLAMLRVWTNTYSATSVQNFEALRADYTALFIGPGTVLAPPWESVHFSERRLIFQKETIDVRAWYRRFGLVVEKFNHEPDDHIGLELSFLSYLADQALQAFKSQDQEKYLELVDARRQFLIQHPLSWAPNWCEQVILNAQTDFFRGLAKVTRGGLLALAQQYEITLEEES